MKKLNHNGNEENRGGNSDSQKIKFAVKFESIDIPNSLKVFEAHSGNSGCSPRITAGAFSGANSVAIFNSKSLDLIGMNISTVITSGSLRGKGVDFSSSRAMNYVHGKSGINLSDLVPAYNDFRNRIYDDKSLIRKNNFRMNKNQIEERTCKESPDNTGGTATKSIIQNIDVSKVTYCKEGYKSEEVATSWAKRLGITHKGIISCANRRAA